MKKQIVLISIPVLLIVTSSIAYILFLRSTPAEDEATALSSSSGINSISLESESSGSSIPLERSSPQSNNTTQDQSSLDAPNSSGQKLPLPSQFTQYEQYANEESTLFTDISIGEGNIAQAGDNLAVVYAGYLSDGTLFDGSRQNEEGLIEPFVFELGAGQVISGWEQGLSGMKEGGQRRLIIPSLFGYGAQGSGSIPPNSLLIFDVKLVQIQKSSQNQPGL